MPGYEFRLIRLPRWALVLAVAAVLALVFTFAVVAAGLFLIAFPIMFVLAAIAALAGSLRGRRVTRRDLRIIDADYEVVHDDRLDRSGRP
jgi:hypothetical protein